MLVEQEKIAYNSIIELHQWIEDVFTGREDKPQSLEQVIESFHQSFTMVTMRGQVITRAEVESMFRNSIGSRPQLHIEIDGYAPLQICKGSALCRYCETHFNGNVSNSRWSVVLIDLKCKRPQWRYLHETAIVPA